ncbi:MAG: hypothetical protein EZS28_049218, partial [Streblomastix strix]
SVWNRYLGDHIQSRYLITIAVPPNLPANMSSGISYGLTRLKDGKILCIAPDRINVAGKVKVVCFDKTDILTEQDLGVMRVNGVRNNNNYTVIPESTENIKDDSQISINANDTTQNHPIVVSEATGIPK